MSEDYIKEDTDHSETPAPSGNTVSKIAASPTKSILRSVFLKSPPQKKVKMSVKLPKLVRPELTVSKEKYKAKKFEYFDMYSRLNDDEYVRPLRSNHSIRSAMSRGTSSNFDKPESQAYLITKTNIVELTPRSLEVPLKRPRQNLTSELQCELCDVVNVTKDDKLSTYLTPVHSVEPSRPKSKRKVKVLTQQTNMWNIPSKNEVEKRKNVVDGSDKWLKTLHNRKMSPKKEDTGTKENKMLAHNRFKPKLRQPSVDANLESFVADMVSNKDGYNPSLDDSTEKLIEMKNYIFPKANQVLENDKDAKLFHKVVRKSLQVPNDKKTVEEEDQFEIKVDEKESLDVIERYVRPTNIISFDKLSDESADSDIKLTNGRRLPPIDKRFMKKTEAIKSTIKENNADEAKFTNSGKTEKQMTALELMEAFKGKKLVTPADRYYHVRKIPDESKVGSGLFEGNEDSDKSVKKVANKVTKNESCNTDVMLDDIKKYFPDHSKGFSNVKIMKNFDEANEQLIAQENFDDYNDSSDAKTVQDWPKDRLDAATKSKKDVVRNTKNWMTVRKKQIKYDSDSESNQTFNSIRTRNGVEITYKNPTFSSSDSRAESDPQWLAKMTRSKGKYKKKPHSAKKNVKTGLTTGIVDSKIMEVLKLNNFQLRISRKQPKPAKRPSDASVIPNKRDVSTQSITVKISKLKKPHKFVPKSAKNKNFVKTNKENIGCFRPNMKSAKQDNKVNKVAKPKVKKVVMTKKIKQQAEDEIAPMRVEVATKPNKVDNPQPQIEAVDDFVAAGPSNLEYIIKGIEAKTFDNSSVVYSVHVPNIGLPLEPNVLIRDQLQSTNTSYSDVSPLKKYYEAVDISPKPIYIVSPCTTCTNPVVPDQKCDDDNMEMTLQDLDVPLRYLSQLPDRNTTLSLINSLAAGVFKQNDVDAKRNDLEFVSTTKIDQWGTFKQVVETKTSQPPGQEDANEDYQQQMSSIVKLRRKQSTEYQFYEQPEPDTFVAFEPKTIDVKSAKKLSIFNMIGDQPIDVPALRRNQTRLRHSEMLCHNHKCVEEDLLPKIDGDHCLEEDNQDVVPETVNDDDSNDGSDVPKNIKRKCPNLVKCFRFFYPDRRQRFF